MIPLLQLVVVLIALGVLLYIVESLLPIDPAIKLAIRVVILLAVVLWLLALVGLLPVGPLRVSLGRLPAAPLLLVGCAPVGEGRRPQDGGPGGGYYHVTTTTRP